MRIAIMFDFCGRSLIYKTLSPMSEAGVWEEAAYFSRFFPVWITVE